MGEFKESIFKYAMEQPIKFTALLTFIVLGGIPVTTFVSYSAVTLVISLVGAVLVELFLLLIGVTALVFVLVFVGCFTVCVTAIVSAIYYGFVATNKTLNWGKASRFYSSRYNPVRLSEHNDDEEESFDKSK